MSSKAYARMETRELAQATGDLEKEFAIDSFGQPLAEAAAQWRRARNRKPRAGHTPQLQVISVAVEKDLLERSDRLARRLGIDRTDLVSRGLRATLAAAGDLP
jgi:hypothetical protein